jgi:hypothetical protein
MSIAASHNDFEQEPMAKSVLANYQTHENDSHLCAIDHKCDYPKFRFIRSKVDERANDQRGIRVYFG